MGNFLCYDRECCFGMCVDVDEKQSSKLTMLIEEPYEYKISSFNFEPL
jgi:hypothetical protein